MAQTSRSFARPKLPRRWPSQSRWAVALIGGALSGEPNDDVKLIQKLAEFQMTRGAIADYHLHVNTHTLDIIIKPTTPLPTGEAGMMGRKTCALGTEDLASKLTHVWTVRVFINLEATWVFACAIAPTPVRAAPSPKTRSVTPAANRGGNNIRR